MKQGIGLSYVTRNWARDEHAFPWGDFKDAVKDNWKQALGVSAITAILPFVLYICYIFYNQMQLLCNLNLKLYVLYKHRQILCSICLQLLQFCQLHTVHMLHQQQPLNTQKHR